MFCLSVQKFPLCYSHLQTLFPPSELTAAFTLCLPQKLRAWQDLLRGYRLPFTVHVESISTTFISTLCNTTWENHEIKSSRKAPLNKGNGLWYNEQNSNEFSNELATRGMAMGYSTCEMFLKSLGSADCE